MTLKSANVFKNILQLYQTVLNKYKRCSVKPLQPIPSILESHKFYTFNLPLKVISLQNPEEA